MKLVMCLECGDIFSPGKRKPKTCECGYSLAKWRDPSAGTLEVASRMGESTDALCIIGMHNGYFRLSSSCATHAQWREATKELLDNSTGYLFHTELRNSPMVIIKVGESNDVFWNQELLREIGREVSPGQ